MKKLVVVTEDSGADLFVDEIDARQAEGEAEHSTTITEHSECTLPLQFNFGPDAMPAMGEVTLRFHYGSHLRTCTSSNISIPFMNKNMQQQEHRHG